MEFIGKWVRVRGFGTGGLFLEDLPEVGGAVGGQEAEGADEVVEGGEGAGEAQQLPVGLARGKDAVEEVDQAVQGALARADKEAGIDRGALTSLGQAGRVPALADDVSQTAGLWIGEERGAHIRREGGPTGLLRELQRGAYQAMEPGMPGPIEQLQKIDRWEGVAEVGQVGDPLELRPLVDRTVQAGVEDGVFRRKGQHRAAEQIHRLRVRPKEMVG